MSEELLQRGLDKSPEKIGRWDFYNIGSTSVKSLKEFGIVRNVDYGQEERKKIDALLVQKKNVIAVVEYKKPSEFNTPAKRSKAIKQELEVAKKLDACIIVATDTQETVWVNVQTGNIIKDEGGHEVKTKFDVADEKLPDLIERIISSINEKNDQIKPKNLVNPTGLAKQIWQDIWSVSGATPENCLYTFVELFIFKYLSDLGVLGEGINFKHLLQRYSYKIEEPEQKALEYYAGTIRPEIKRLFPESLVDKTTIINGTIFVSKDQKAVKGYSTVFKKVLDKFEKYGKLEYIDYDFKSQLFESFLKESISKQNWGQFFTPIKVVRSIVEMAKDDIKPYVKICDPACGVGKFLLEPVLTKFDQFYVVNKGEIESKITIKGFDKGFDKDEQKTIILAKANMLIYFSDLVKENPTITEKFSQLFNETFQLKTNSILGTLSDIVENEYDLILTNPPYVTGGSSNLKDEINKDGELNKHYKVNAMGVEGLFMEWIIKALKPGGKAFIVVPENLLFRPSDGNLRKYIIDSCFINGIISLPEKTFFSTIQKTSILSLTKKTNVNQIQKQPIFCYLVSEIGENRDVNRFKIDQDDLKEAVELYRGFMGSPEYFIKNNSDKRCKIVGIDWFFKNAETTWSIERNWNKQDKIEIGIRENEKNISIADYKLTVEDVVNSISAFKNELDTITKPAYNIAYVTKSMDDLFYFKSGNPKLTLSYLDKNKGNYVVYSSNTKNNGIFGYLNSYDFDEECIQITTNGAYAGTVFYRKKHKFSINPDARVLIRRDENLNYKYLLYKLRQAFEEHDFNWQNKPTISKTKHITIDVPVDEYGNYSFSIQEELAANLEKIDYIKSSILQEYNKLNELSIEL